MLSIGITDIKNFMTHLLSKDTFDRFYLVEASLRMGISYHLDGHLNPDFYDSDTVLHRPYCLWKEAKPLVFHIIKGKRLPLGCRIVLAFPDMLKQALLRESHSSFQPEDIEGIYLNIIFEPGSLRLTSGISYRAFSLDKSLDHCVEDHLQGFLKEKGIC